MAPIEVMIVEDDAVIQSMIARHLQSHNFHCTCVGSAEEALDILSSTNPRLVILDLELPRAYGTAFLRSFKKLLPHGHEVPSVIVLSGHHDKDIMSYAFDCGVDLFIPKPFALEDLAYIAKAFTRTKVTDSSIRRSQ